jgi:hypothetical protein
MKTTLHFVSYLCCALCLLSTQKLSSQIYYIQDFNSVNHKWTTSDFSVTDVAVCNTGYSFRSVYKSTPNSGAPVTTYSPNLGTSNGERITLTYSYKILLFDNVLPNVPAVGNNWGNLTILYGSTPKGPWNVADNVTYVNHIPSNECTVRKAAFNAANGSAVYLKIIAGEGADYNNSYMVYIDDLILNQDSLTITSEITDSSVKVFPNPFSDYVRVDYPGIINNLSIFNNQGQAVNVENIGSDYSRLDLTSLSRGKYTMQITGDNNEITTINIEKRDVN